MRRALAALALLAAASLACDAAAKAQMVRPLAEVAWGFARETGAR